MAWLHLDDEVVCHGVIDGVKRDGLGWPTCWNGLHGFVLTDVVP